MAGLPSFFQQRGKTVLDELADYELGGDLNEEEEEADNGIMGDSAFTQGYDDSDLELPSFFQPSVRDNGQSQGIQTSSDHYFPSRVEDVNLSHLLDNFQWPTKGSSQTPQTIAPLASDTGNSTLHHRNIAANMQPSSSLSSADTTAAPTGTSRPPHEYYEMLARSSGTPLDPPPPIPFPNNQVNHQMQYQNLAGPQSQGTDLNHDRNAVPMMLPPQGFSQHHQVPHPNFIHPGQYPVQVGPPPFQMYSNQPNFSGPQMMLQRGPPEGVASRGPPRADPRLQFPNTGPHPVTPQQHHPSSSTQDPLLQLFHNAQQRQAGQPPLPMQPPNIGQPPNVGQPPHIGLPPNMSQPVMLMRPDMEDRTRMGAPNPNLFDRNQISRDNSVLFQQMAVTTAGAGTGTDTTGRVGYPKSEMMTSSDVRFVVTKVVQPLESNDPYSDDYYFLQTNFKKNAKKVEEAVSTGMPPPGPVYLPFPAWLETKNRIASQLEDTRKAFGDRSREWEEKEQVLGHIQRTDVTRPRELLHAPTLQEMMDLDTDEDGDGVFRMPFVTRLWSMRQAVQKGFEALYTLQELNHLLLSPLLANDPYAKEEILLQINRAVSLLSQSVGIRPAPEGSIRGTGGPGLGSEITLEGGLVAAILQTAKGKKLMSRSINLLIPEQRWALLPVILARVLQSDPADQPADEQAVEKKLLGTLVQFIEHSHEFQKNQQALVSGSLGASAPFTTMLLGNLRLCVKSVMVSQMDKSRLRATLKISRDRAVVMNVIVQIGDEVAKDAGEVIATEWAQMREAFMCMLDE